MVVCIQSKSGSQVGLGLIIDLEESMLASAEAIPVGLNEISAVSVNEIALKAFDTDGSKIEKSD